MRKATKEENAKSHRSTAPEEQLGRSAAPKQPLRDPHAKGAMREPTQTPSGTKGEQTEVQQALEELEKEKGDWSKGG
jgi:hypothetical protein